MGADVELPAGGKVRCSMCIGLGEDYASVKELAERMRARGTETFVRRTDAFWRLWVARERFDYAELPAEVVDLFLRSLLILRPQVDHRGAIIAANDHVLGAYARSTCIY